MVQERKKLIEKTIENIYALRQRIMSEMHLLFKEEGITHSQMIVLRIIQNNENTNLKDLAALLGITSSATTQVVNELVKKGYLGRKRNPDDRRVLNLTLTDKTKTQLDSIRNKSFSELYSMFDVLSDDELRDYYRLSNKIIGNSPERSQSRKEKTVC